jgi:anti-anti-sigma factor
MLADVQHQMENALREGPRSLVVDMSAVREPTSTTIAALLWIKRQCSARGIETLLRAPSRRTLEVLDRVGLLAVLMVEPTTDSGGSLTRPARPR